MKKYLLPFLSFLTVQLLNAQSEYNYQYDIDVRSVLMNPADPWLNEIYTPPAGVKQIVFTYSSGKSSSSSICKYNSSGKLEELVGKKKNGKESRKTLLYYNEKQLLEKVEFYKNAKYDYSVIYSYNPGSKITSLTRQEASGKIKNKFTWDYTSDNCLASSLTYKRNAKTASHSWEYQYLDSCKKSLAIHRNKRGKIKEQWSFMCDESGRQKKNLQTVCTTVHPGNEFIIITHEGTDQKGKSFRNVGKFTLKDTLPLEWRSYNHKDELIHESIYDKDYKIMLSSKAFKDGKPRFEHHYQYANGRLISKKFIRRGKEDSRTEFEYDALGRVKGTKTYFNNRLKRSLTITYS